ncbi:heme o synthase [Niabella yanshanensis]|uniref:Protoheme IX farnesyltransferase n=1 Tax=Niabella yanshanensis TaxID=577386 RepID=A0ABZ0W0V1_9BACT|nr:heme o synthase [Niabella yanshanensis]WQD36549.1 heme o synthase [Niabella yanshanensis]
MNNLKQEGAGFKDYIQLVKPSLSIMVVFSSVISYLLVPGVLIDWWRIVLLFAGGMLVTGSANTINMVVERDTDALMKRTAKRPIASGRITPEQGWGFAVLTGALGVFILGYYFNWTAAALAAFSLFLYAFVYTPLKKVNSIAVLVGAVPGALPCLIGWVAGFVPGQDIDWVGGAVMFGIQFLWQFPHFWAIAWVAHKDYSEAGFKLLPSDKGPTKFTALQTLVYSLLLVPITVAPFFTGISSTAGVKGIIALALIIIANLFMIMRCVTLYSKMDVKSARNVMFGSYMYLPVVLLALLLAKV